MLEDCEHSIFIKVISFLEEVAKAKSLRSLVLDSIGFDTLPICSFGSFEVNFHFKWHIYGASRSYSAGLASERMVQYVGFARIYRQSALPKLHVMDLKFSKIEVLHLRICKLVNLVTNDLGNCLER